MRISPFVRCPAPCGKMHVVMPLGFRKQECPWCGTDLINLVLGIKK